MRILPTSSSKRALGPAVFKHVQVEIELSLQYRAHFVDLLFQKCSKPFSFLNIFGFQVEIKLSLQFRTLLSTSSSKSAPDPTIVTFFYVKSSSRYSLVHLLPTSSSKIAPDPSVLLRFLYETEPLATVL